MMHAQTMGAPRHHCIYSPLLLLVVFGIAAVAAAATDPKVVASIEIEIPRGDDRNIGGDDQQGEECEEWAAAGECQNNPDYMRSHCAFSCNNSKGETKAEAYVLEGEDAGVGAFRFAEEYCTM